MQGRYIFLDALREQVEVIISLIEEREIVETDFEMLRELAEQLHEEIVTLQDS